MTKREVLRGIIAKAAREGAARPTNADMIAILRARSFAGNLDPSATLTRMKDAGEIMVERRGSARRIQITVSGKWTAWCDTRLAKTKMASGRAKPVRVENSAARPIPIHTTRVRHIETAPRLYSGETTSCFKCGANTRFGCKHYPPASLAGEQRATAAAS